MTWLVKVMMSSEPGWVETAEPEVQSRTRRSHGDTARDWLCAWCLNRVANEKDRLVWGGRSEFSFVNVVGVEFHIITFARTFGCRRAGEPTLEHTWFPGHAWSYCVCSRCRMHLGWHYIGPSEFVGLIRDRLVRAVVIMN